MREIKNSKFIFNHFRKPSRKLRVAYYNVIIAINIYCSPTEKIFFFKHSL